MGSPYTSTTPSGYNTNPPSDDGAQTEANRLKWATIKSKLTDPLNTFAAAVNAAIAAAFGKIIGGAGVTSTSISATISSSDQGKIVRATAAGITLTTPDASGVGSPFVVGFLNNSSGDITLDGNGSQTIDGAGSVTVPAGAGGLLNTDGTNWFTFGQNWRASLPRGYIDGCVLSNSSGDATNDIDIAAGVCRDSTNTVSITVAAMTGKQLDANWVAGGAAGMRNSAAGITDTTYHIYAVSKADGTQDIYAHTSLTVATVITALQAETGGADYLYARRIGSIIRASSAILQFTQAGDYFRLKTPPLDINTTSLGTSSTSYALTVPSGLSVEAHLNAYASHAASTTPVYLRHPSDTDTAPANSAAPLGTVVGANTLSQVRVFTNTSREIAAVSAGTSTTLRAAVLGYQDLRGKQ